MRVLVADASVVVKWILPDRTEEHTAEAMAMLDDLQRDRLNLVQPPHWIVETAAVVVRLRPHAADRAVRLLHSLELPIDDDEGTYAVGCRLAEELRHHLFDTLYHAIALRRAGAELVTADDRYFRKAKRFGAIRRLADYVAADDRT
ncbi:MAG: hypothetical protein QOD06_2499 [Candidatus Binatota bacterium]|nr:hypothetical protein [Candidatus Binatota bacterium]